MASGIRVTVAVGEPGDCPIARVSERSARPIERVSTSVAPPGSGGSVTEFLADCDELPEDVDATATFPYGSATLYRIRHPEDARCPCTCLGSFGCPVSRYVAADGELTLVFHADDFEQLQDVMGEFRERYPSVDVQQMLRPPLDGPAETDVFVNRGKLTDRQLEVLERAHEAGYFERPRGANASELAAELGISQSTFSEHLVAAQRKILDDVLDAPR